MSRRVKIKTVLEEDSKQEDDYDREKELKGFVKEKKTVKVPTINELKTVRDTKKKEREEMYDKVLSGIIVDIKKLNEDDIMELNFKIPQNMVNPNYDFRECVIYVVKKLRIEGKLFVKFYDPDTIYINWNKIEKKK